jgi:hypothetical protein
MKKKLQHWLDMLTIWAIHRFNVQLPDLQREEHPKPGKIYYYYGRWLRIVPHDKPTAALVKDYLRTHPVHLLDISDDDLSRIGRLNEKVAIQNEIAARLCPTCIFSRLGLPCKKVYRMPSRLSDLCFTHKYQLIKGKKYDEEVSAQ